jgi:hypothetical protein
MHDVGDFRFKKLKPLKEFKVRNIEHWRFCLNKCRQNLTAMVAHKVCM